MVTPVIKNGFNPNNNDAFMQFGQYYAQQKVEDGENAMYHQTIAIRPATTYKVTVYGQIKAPPATQANRPKPYCELYICENGPNKCGRLGSNNVKKTGYKFKTKPNQQTADIQIWLYCPGTYEGRINTLWTDGIGIQQIGQAVPLIG